MQNCMCLASMVHWLLPKKPEAKYRLHAVPKTFFHCTKNYLNKWYIFFKVLSPYIACIKLHSCHSNLANLFVCHLIISVCSK